MSALVLTVTTSTFKRWAKIRYFDNTTNVVLLLASDQETVQVGQVIPPCSFSIKRLNTKFHLLHASDTFVALWVIAVSLH